MSDDEPDFEISEASISGTHRRADIFDAQARSRRRVTRIAAQISVIVVITLIAGFFVVRAPLQSFIVTQRGPTPTTAPSLGSVIIQTNVAAGILTVNGKTVPFPQSNVDQSVTLTKQHSVITLTAPPFQPITCSINSAQLNIQNGGRCSSNSTSNNIPVLNMNVTLNDMPPHARQQFDAYITQKLTDLNALQTPISAKEHYATGTNIDSIPTVALAQAPLQAQVQVTPSNNNPGFFPSAECISMICPGGDFMPPGVTTSLSFAFLLQLSVGWRFLNGAGRQVATYRPPANIASYGLGPYSGFYVQVQYDATTGWSDVNDSINPIGRYGGTNPVSELAGNLCQSGASLVSYLIQQQGTNAYSGQSFGGQNVLAGCLFAVTAGNTQQNPADFNADPTKDINNAWFLVHFGAVLSVNAKAHALLLQLPQATAQEVSEIHNATQ